MALFKTTAMDLASGSVLLSEALSAYPKHKSKQPRGQASLSWVWNLSGGFEKGLKEGFLLWKIVVLVQEVVIHYH